MYVTIVIICRSGGGVSSILKDADVRFSVDDQSMVCCVLSSADYCLETTIQVSTTMIKICLWLALNILQRRI